MDWLGGSGYDHLGLYIHGVEYHKKNGEIISGTYMPLLFESPTDPIVSSREELGMPDSSSSSHHSNYSRLLHSRYHYTRRVDRNSHTSECLVLTVVSTALHSRSYSNVLIAYHLRLAEQT
jgi:hypothetical protein